MNLKLIDSITPRMVDAGHKVFQIHRFAENEFEHVRRLERWADFPMNAHVIDMGSGTGEVARIFNALRPDLKFTLVNVSAVQNGYADQKHRVLQESFLSTEEENESYDAVMFCFSIGHEDHYEALSEAYRLLVNKGILFIVDMARTSGTNAAMTEVEYVVHERVTIEKLAEKVGFKKDIYIEPYDNGKYGAHILGQEYENVFGGTIPAIWRMVKC